MLHTRTPHWALSALLLAIAMAHAPAAAERRVVRVTAERFSFTPSEIAVTAGEEVELRLRSDDTVHGFHVLDRDINVLIPERGRGEVTVVFRGDEPGRYEFECSHLCGAGHPFMHGVIVVRPSRGEVAGDEPVR